MIGYCNLSKTICAFRISQIIGEVTIKPDTYKIPDDFNIIDYLNMGWGVQLNSKEIDLVVLHIKPQIYEYFRKHRLHASESIVKQDDGSAVVKLKVRDMLHFRNWLIGWGDQIEVIAPQELRDQIKNLANSLVNIYSSELPPN